MDAPQTRRRWFSFSLRTLLIFTVLIGSLMGWIVKERRQSAREREIGRELEEQGWEVHYNGVWYSPELFNQAEKQSWWRESAQKILGNRIYYLAFHYEPAVLSPPFANLTQLKNLTRLKWLRCVDPKESDLSPLAGLTELDFLDLSETGTSDLVPLAGMAKLTHLDLSFTYVSDLTPLMGLTKLESLYLSRTPVSDLTPLAGLKELKDLNLRATQISPEQIESLKKALPNCQIDW